MDNNLLKKLEVLERRTEAIYVMLSDLIDKTTNTQKQAKKDKPKTVELLINHKIIKADKVSDLVPFISSVEQFRYALGEQAFSITLANVSKNIAGGKVKNPQGYLLTSLRKAAEQ